jgi:uncharacterized protein (DUF305 family)
VGPGAFFYTRNYHVVLSFSKDQIDIFGYNCYMKKYRTILVLILLAIISLGYYAFAYTDVFTWLAHSEHSNMDEEQMDHADHDMASSTTGISERQFIEHMIPHHQEAVDTSRIILTESANAEVRALASSIISAQEKEIADMKTWYETWYGTPYQDDGSYTPMMRDLSSLSSPELERAYLEDMIPHHTMALNAVQTVAPNITQPEIKALVSAILSSQSSEIVTMRILLKTL